MSLRISIIINNYNYDRYLDAAIESALNQSYGNREIIVVDDGSTDNSRRILAAYEGRITSIVKKNGGQASAFNLGFQRASGDIIYFLDADDVLLENALELGVSRWEPDASVLQFPLRILRGNQKTSDLYPEEISPGNAVELLLKYHYYHAPPTSGNMFSREFLNAILPMPEEEFRICADGYLLTKAPFYGKRIVLTEPLAFYRIHSSNGYNRRSNPFRLDKIQSALRIRDATYTALVEEANKRALKVDSSLCQEIVYLYNRLLYRKVAGSGYLPIDTSIVVTYGLMLRALFVDRLTAWPKRFRLCLRCLALVLLPLTWLIWLFDSFSKKIRVPLEMKS